MPSLNKLRKQASNHTNINGVILPMLQIFADVYI